ncbi:hypothetical protein A0H81_10532 [Grifola frondosa]|uniref:Uncharacterized protein n=1 Tax=Grifola frondosa TaxID=5627 RepID=A0A1C7LZ08_GRIFR|nr:hypothetical protein A0H81_10532 [Grifola frondosa]
MEVPLVPTIALIFNPSADTITVKTIEQTDCDNVEYTLTTNLAPSFGELSVESVKKLDSSRQTVMIAGVNRTLALIPPAERSFDRVIKTCLQCPLLEDEQDHVVERKSHFYMDNIDFFNMNNTEKGRIAESVHTWFMELIEDDDVVSVVQSLMLVALTLKLVCCYLLQLKSTKINIATFSTIVATMGAAVKHFRNVFGGHENCEKTIVDIGVLRYPDLKHPYFKVYRIQLTAWRDATYGSLLVLYVGLTSSPRWDCESILVPFWMIVTCGTLGDKQNGTFNMHRFKPNQDVINSLSAKALEMASLSQ